MLRGRDTTDVPRRCRCPAPASNFPRRTLLETPTPAASVSAVQCSRPNIARVDGVPLEHLASSIRHGRGDARPPTLNRAPAKLLRPQVKATPTLPSANSPMRPARQALPSHGRTTARAAERAQLLPSATQEHGSHSVERSHTTKSTEHLADAASTR
jgi:hypothetical protein